MILERRVIGQWRERGERMALLAVARMYEDIAVHRAEKSALVEAGLARCAGECMYAFIAGAFEGEVALQTC